MPEYLDANNDEKNGNGTDAPKPVRRVGRRPAARKEVPVVTEESAPVEPGNSIESAPAVLYSAPAEEMVRPVASNESAPSGNELPPPTVPAAPASPQAEHAESGAEPHGSFRPQHGFNNNNRQRDRHHHHNNRRDNRNNRPDDRNSRMDDRNGYPDDRNISPRSNENIPDEKFGSGDCCADNGDFGGRQECREAPPRT